MLFQKVLKGVPASSGINPSDVWALGLLCSWWHRVGDLPRAEVPGRLTNGELLNHLARYYQVVPGEIYTYGDNSPFISTTGGTYQATNPSYKHFPAIVTAVRFATRNYTVHGFVVEAWLPILGRPSVALEPFGEEVRDPHQYPTAYGHHSQGEIVAKIVIPPTQIRAMDFYNGPATAARLRAGGVPMAVSHFDCPHYQPPEDYSNVREIV